MPQPAAPGGIGGPGLQRSGPGWTREERGERGRRPAGATAGAGDAIRVLIVDDHALFRRGLEMVLEQEDDVEVVGRRVTAPRPSRRPRSSCPTWC